MALKYMLLPLLFIEILLLSHPTKSDPIIDGVCKLVDCGQGTCNASNQFLVPFKCVCFPGWKNIEIGTLVGFLPCVIPNCTLDLGCGESAPPPPFSLLPPILPPPINLSDPCTYTLCGEGKCVTIDETSHVCECNPGSANLLGSSNLPCFKQCSLGADCGGIGFGAPPPPSSNVGTTFKDLFKHLVLLILLMCMALYIPWNMWEI
ncbi:uncharacterized protein LOC18425012 isoform X2 [Amborella trichopoda]|uniref:uncharacterized protein LOC18425012 isoform X2 n=1 Tax=Amborella trichopoda TaxID=13333 RepID=UPI0009BEB915|nr:uncharacterized protein LOC18425012 isoform X2 [Amborella trichopoda]|eukprot:XP_006829632.3 uncharacterized protein LOC18425012 isoform X2 [Amborella trichopoda]